MPTVYSLVLLLQAAALSTCGANVAETTTSLTSPHMTRNVEELSVAGPLGKRFLRVTDEDRGLPASIESSLRIILEHEP
ncbi:hypothetical protein PsorP6_011930 [Peronosclerospora sorghi]|uniref:Uncharacterized protein n=1 Tax=Peronosclerospora sorghi TaxID=230839 RepID=A0ACC0WHP4_9STRA|nr:hypothetical protein PsorP6_011930 [Peronosclerospora sorghi]